MVTVVDASSFLDIYNSCDRISERSDLGYSPPINPFAPIQTELEEDAELGKLSVAQLLAEQVARRLA